MVSSKTGFGSDTDNIFRNRIGSDSKNPLSDHLWRVACPRHHKTRNEPLYSCIMLNIPKKGKRICASGIRSLSQAVSIESRSVSAVHCIVTCFKFQFLNQTRSP